MEYKNIKYQLQNGVAHIIFNRPPLNILNIEMMKEICHALDSLIDVKDLKLIVFSAEHKAFSAGVDVGEHLGEKVEEMIRVFHNIFRLIIKVGKPTLAVVNGACVGGGCEIALFCDMVIATESSKFGQPEIQVGVFPPVACLILPQILPHKKAMELLLTGQLITASEAEAIGLVNKVVPVEQLQNEVNNLINKITSLSSPILSFTRKAALAKFYKEFLENLVEVEEIYLKELMNTEDATEGLRAFLEKRQPAWKNK